MKINKKTLLLILILLVAAILRLWQLGSIPPHLTPDEAALGYNAYSIFKTGRDEYGELLPIIFKSFGDYKPGLYIYLTAPIVGIFGLNEFNTRLVSAISGVISVFLIYKIVQLFKLKHKNLDIVSAAIAAFSPWLVIFSRGAWESNTALTMTLAGIYFFMKIKNKSYYLILSSAMFGLSLLTYQGSKLTTLLVLILLGIVYFVDIKKLRLKHIIPAAIVGLLISAPIIISMFSGKVGRLGVASVFTYPRDQQFIQDFINESGTQKDSLPYYLYYSEPLNFLRGILGRYTNHFSTKFLFFEGDWQNPRHSAPYQGMMLLSDIIFIVPGLFILIRNKNIKSKKIIFGLLLLSPLPAVLSRDQVHSIRSMLMVFPLIVITALGVKYLSSKLKLMPVLVLGLSAISVIYFLDAYFVHMPNKNAEMWEYGYKQIVEIITPIQSNYKEVKVRQSFAQPYIYFLFYQQYDPVRYQANARLVENETGDVGQVERLDNICFCPIDWSINRGDKGVLFAADPLRIPFQDSEDPREFNIIKDIYYPNGKAAFRVVSVKNE